MSTSTIEGDIDVSAPGFSLGPEVVFSGNLLRNGEQAGQDQEDGGRVQDVQGSLTRSQPMASATTGGM
jgi:hypothetical protein